MPTPTYTVFSGGIAASLIQAQLDQGLSLGGLSTPFPFNLPPIPGIGIKYLTPGSAPAAGNVGLCNLFGYAFGSLAAAPLNIDLTTAIKDPFGNALAFARVNLALIFNDATNDAHVLSVKPGATNPFDAWISGTTPALKVLPGYALSGVNVPGLAMLGGLHQSGYLVDATHKVLTLDPGANTFGYRLFLFGRDA